MAAEQDAESAATQGLRAARQPLIIIPPTPLTFIPIAPCRVADTRGNGFTGLYGPPSMAGGVSRNFTITGQCGIPAGALAVSFNFTVWNTLSFGDLKVYPTGGTVAAVSNLNWNPGMLALANAAVVQLGTGANAGSITTVNESGSPIDLFIDVNGYYGPTGSLPYFNGYDAFTKTSSGDFFFPTSSSITMPAGGACMVTATSQFSHGTVPTAQGPYFRIAIQRGVASPTDDAQYGMYIQPGLTKSPMATRQAVIPINANETTLLGCFLSSTADANWQTGVACRVSFVCF
jgi:hypothetical protein